jgi:hypothetical protein
MDPISYPIQQLSPRGGAGAPKNTGLLTYPLTSSFLGLPPGFFCFLGSSSYDPTRVAAACSLERAGYLYRLHNHLITPPRLLSPFVRYCASLRSARLRSWTRPFVYPDPYQPLATITCLEW